MEDNAIREATETPRVWVGCLACYNAGRLVGEWVDAIDAADMTVDAVHGGAGRYRELRRRDGGSPHEEMWCMDTEYMPVSGEMSPMEATRYAKAMEDVPDYFPRAAVRAFVECRGSHYVDWDNLATEFEDAYHGEWDSFTDYIRDTEEDCGTLNAIPEELRGYFDWDAYARDQRGDYSTEPAPGGGVFVFSD